MRPDHISLSAALAEIAELRRLWSESTDRADVALTALREENAKLRALLHEAISELEGAGIEFADPRVCWETVRLGVGWIYAFTTDARAALVMPERGET